MRLAGDEGSRGIAAAAADGEPWPTRTLNQLTRAGLRLDEPIDLAREGETGVLVVDLPTPDQPTEYKIGLRNFYVLTRYNRSFFYALTVYQLGEAVKARWADATSSHGPPPPASPRWQAEQLWPPNVHQKTQQFPGQLVLSLTIAA